MKKGVPDGTAPGPEPAREESDLLALPAEFDESRYRAAVEFDELLDKGPAAEALQAKALVYGEKLMHHHDSIATRWPPITIDLDHPSLFDSPLSKVRWPPSLYIPAGADWRPYWFLPPPDANRYARDWAPQPSPAGFSSASRLDGKLYCIQRIRTVDKYVKSEAGVGVLFTPKRTLSVVSLEPQVDCSGEYRWYQMMDRLVAGSTLVKTSLILAAWHQIPGPKGWDLIHSKQFTVITAGPNSGAGYYAVTSYQRSFSGKDLATPFLVQAAHTYLLGVVARVSVWSTLTSSEGYPLPLVEDGTFKVWGSLGCVVPQIEVVEQQVYIP